MVATVEDGGSSRCARTRAPALRRVRVPEGDRDGRRAERPGPRAVPAAAPAATATFERVRGTTRSTTSARACGRSSSAHGGGRSAGTWATPALQLLARALGRRASSTRSARRTPTRRPRRTSPAASSRAALLYGWPMIVPMPDLERTDFLLMVGANPLVSHGSSLGAPRNKDQLHGHRRPRRARVVVDPRRTETARAFEHVAVDPDGDAWLLLSMLHVIFAEGLADDAAIERQARGVDALRAARPRVPARGHRGANRRCRPREVAPAGPRSSRPPGAPPSTAAPAPASGAPARSSRSCSTRSTLVTGNLDRAGRRGVRPTRRSTSARIARHGRRSRPSKVRSRVGGLPEVLGSLPASLMAAEIDDAGPGQMRALFVSAGNPVLSVPNGGRARGALDRLDLPVAIDLYVNETPRTPTTCCRRPRSTSATTFRCRSSRSILDAVHPVDRGGGRAARRGAAGVGDRSSDLAADRRRRRRA